MSLPGRCPNRIHGGRFRHVQKALIRFGLNYCMLMAQQSMTFALGLVGGRSAVVCTYRMISSETWLLGRLCTGWLNWLAQLNLLTKGNGYYHEELEIRVTSIQSRKGNTVEEALPEGDGTCIDYVHLPERHGDLIWLIWIMQRCTPESIRGQRKKKKKNRCLGV